MGFGCPFSDRKRIFRLVLRRSTGALSPTKNMTPHVFRRQAEKKEKERFFLFYLPSHTRFYGNPLKKSKKKKKNDLFHFQNFCLPAGTCAEGTRPLPPISVHFWRCADHVEPGGITAMWCSLLLPQAHGESQSRPGLPRVSHRATPNHMHVITLCHHFS